MAITERVWVGLLSGSVSASEVDGSIDRAGRSGLVVAGAWVARVGRRLPRSRVGGVAGYPLGGGKPTVKAIEAASAVKDGAGVLWVVPAWWAVSAGDIDAMRAELTEIARAARAADPTVRLLAMIADIPGAALAAATAASRQSGFDGICAVGGDVGLAATEAEAASAGGEVLWRV